MIDARQRPTEQRRSRWPNRRWAPRRPAPGPDPRPTDPSRAAPGIEELFERYRDERLTPEQVGEALGLEASSIRRQLRAGELPGYRLGTGTKAPWRLVKSEVIAVLRTRWNQDQHHDLQATGAAAADSKE